ncbi:hypothetical protein AS156_18530 [Bradyrhizobium macuxiense]|uniref:Uncharacterized protein n=1 Tax=Bradyrhizobium macuxiense TaxID=1755647 RepID=A0A125Q6N7_9BRAD|nr:hypothetical protein AS156_18530 [Bradyrhizobium macuxiense]
MWIASVIPDGIIMIISKKVIPVGMVLLFASPAWAGGIKNFLRPLSVSTAKSTGCTGGGIPTCPRTIQGALLTDDQVKTIQQWHSENVEAAKSQLAK